MTEEEQEPMPDPRAIPEEIQTAFVVYQRVDGHWASHSELSLFDDVNILREPDLGDFSHGCSAIILDAEQLRYEAKLKDILAQALPQVVNQTVNGVMQSQLQMARAMAEQQEAHEIAAKAGLVVPNPGGSRQR